MRIECDDGYSARDLERPGIERALQDLENGADALVVAKLDRLSRSVLDFAGLVERAKREGWAIVVLDLGLDMSSPQGALTVNVLAAFAQFERELISQRIREALAVKREQGVRLGRRPVLPAKVTRRIKRERKAGATLQAIADGLNESGVSTAHGGRQWYSSTIRAVLNRTP